MHDRNKKPTEPSPLTGPQAHYLASRLMRLLWLLVFLLAVIAAAAWIR